MQSSEALETVSLSDEQSKEVAEAEKPEEKGLEVGVTVVDEEPVHDVSGKTWELSLLDESEDSIKGLYVYKNVFNLIPRSVEAFEQLKTLKFFGNEINLFASEMKNLSALECLQVKLSSPGLSSLPLQRLKALKELELCKVPQRSSALRIFGEIASLQSLTKLVICHFSIRYLPPEIGSLNKLELLDVSFNKLKKLPNEITALTNLKSLKVASNKLIELPSSLAGLQELEFLDLSNNRFTSLGSIKLTSMPTLQKLNLQYNKLLHCCQIPSWICCNFEGNGKDTSNDEFISSSLDLNVDVDDDAVIQNCEGSQSCASEDQGGCLDAASSVSPSASPSLRCSTTHRRKKGWKRHDNMQQRARQEHLNSVRKWKSDHHHHIITMNLDERCKEYKPSSVASVVPECLSESSALPESDIGTVEAVNEYSRCALSGEDDLLALFNHDEDKNVMLDSISVCRRFDNELRSNDEQEDESCLDASKEASKSKRHCDGELDNPKPTKSRKPVDTYSSLSCKYSVESFCSSKDRLPDGFYDAGRDRPFMPIHSYEQDMCLDSREVILLDRENDEDLNVIALSAQALLSPLKPQIKQEQQFADNDLQRATMLALFVSNWFGGIDKSNLVIQMRKSVAGSNYQKPFICTCPTGSAIDKMPSKQIDNSENWDFTDHCEQSLRRIKRARNSNIVPIGALHWGLCRHRALLMKYLSDRLDPPIPCELVRGYLDFMPHAWNTILVRRNDLWVRMVVDTCCPIDIREETDSEYFCRYIPFSRILVSMESDRTLNPSQVMPSLLLSDKIEKQYIREGIDLVHVEIGKIDGAHQVRALTIAEESCRGELERGSEEVEPHIEKKHSCIVEIYGHQISSKWNNIVDGNEDHLLQSAVVMEHIKGGSLSSYIEKLSKSGEKHVPLDLALFIARDVACALVELHSKHIIHRDIKSENILIDLKRKRADNAPVVKLCDFDRAIPLRSSSHTCCISHHGVPPPDVCVGTPRWMAPEVLQAMHERTLYGLEVDIWSYGCLLLELLTLDVPYAADSKSEFHELIQRGQPPSLPEELDVLRSSKSVYTDAENESKATMRFLVDMFHQCMQSNPNDRPTAVQLYDMLQEHTNNFVRGAS
ncbi:hypothetical protein Scep_009737 [Stephania cephalantha]|uniref:Protein kinase domain-containing protein n=1 Tax=Stephania cephalantha TaxID=152367 RepID=A0AAP0JU58_9MAGN